MHKRILLAALVAAAAVVCPSPSARATLSSATNSVSYTGNGATTVYTVTFKFLQNADLLVTVNGVTKTLGTDYTLAGTGNATGTLTFTTAPINGAAVVISRQIALTQLTSLRTTRLYDPAAVETALDRGTMGTQQVDRRVTSVNSTLQAQIDNVVLNGIQTTTGSAFTRVPSDSAPSNGFNIVVNPETNSVRSDVHSSTIAGGGLNGFLQKIGSVAGSNASYATIGGGYDNINNMLAGTICGGAHHFLDGAAGADHGFIGGGSTNIINSTTGHYSAIGAGTLNTISGSGNGAAIFGGQSNTASNAGVFIGGGSLNTAAGDSAVIAGGSSNSVDSNGLGGSIGGGTQNAISGTGATYGRIGGGTQNKVRNLANAPTYGTVGGGLNNSVEHFAAVIAGGQNNVASGNSAVVAGGTTNTASATRAIVTGGANNIASGQDSYVPFGQQNTASGQYASARGLRATATINGIQCTAVGFFAANGDAQTCEAPMRRQTTDATSSSFTTDGSALLVLPDNSTWVFEVLVVARNIAANEHAGYRLSGVIKRDVGVATTAIVGTVEKVVLAETVAAWDANATADTTSGDLRIRAVGEAAKTIKWVAHVRLASVTQ